MGCKWMGRGEKGIWTLVDVFDSHPTLAPTHTLFLLDMARALPFPGALLPSLPVSFAILESNPHRIVATPSGCDLRLADGRSWERRNERVGTVPVRERDIRSSPLYGSGLMETEAGIVLLNRSRMPTRHLHNLLEQQIRPDIHNESSVVGNWREKGGPGERRLSFVAQPLLTSLTTTSTIGSSVFSPSVESAKTSPHIPYSTSSQKM
ncbi:hypothetical protein NMY22_g6338 [Coprinellus aureogranulatus]|nr:hypothetical protein NMY22_g6338 [Coprinellus aureogranulatus]